MLRINDAPSGLDRAPALYPGVTLRYTPGYEMSPPRGYSPGTNVHQSSQYLSSIKLLSLTRQDSGCWHGLRCRDLRCRPDGTQEITRDTLSYLKCRPDGTHRESLQSGQSISSIRFLSRSVSHSQLSILNPQFETTNSQFSQIRVIRVPRKPAFALHTLRQPYSILNSQLSIHHDPIHHSCRYIYLR